MYLMYAEFTYCAQGEAFSELQFKHCKPFKCQLHKMVKNTETIRRQQSTNCLSAFGHFVELTLKGLEKKNRYTYVPKIQLTFNFL